MKAEVGVVRCGPIAQAWKQVKTVFRTWSYCRKNNLPCDRWYGVFVEGTENVLAFTGPLPGAKERAEKIAEIINEQKC